MPDHACKRSWNETLCLAQTAEINRSDALTQTAVPVIFCLPQALPILHPLSDTSDLPYASQIHTE